MAKVTVSAKTYTFTNGTANDATPVDASFTTLFNNDDALKTAVNHLEDGNFNETATLTLNTAYGGSSPSSNGGISIERGTEANSTIRWNESSDIWEFSNNGSTYFPVMTPEQIEGLNTSSPPVYVSSSSFTVSKINCVNSTNTGFIRKITTTTVDLGQTGYNSGTHTGGIAQSEALSGTISTSGSSTTVSGSGTSFNTDFQVGDVLWTASGGRRITAIASAISMTVESAITLGAGTAYKRGGEAPNTWYNLYAIFNGSTSGLIVSSRNVAGGDTLVDLPSGYIHYRQMPFAFRNNSSSDIIPFFVGSGWPTRPFIGYNVPSSEMGGPTAGTTNLILNGTATSAGYTQTTTTGNTFIPAISRVATLNVIANYNSNNASIYVRATGDTHTGYSLRATSASTYSFSQIALPLNTSQQVEYRTAHSGTSVSIDVLGFTVTEVN